MKNNNSYSLCKSKVTLTVLLMTWALVCIDAVAVAKESDVNQASILSADESAADKLTAILNPIKTFSATFNQRVVDEQGEMLEDYQGTMIVKKPGKLYWVSDEPVSQTVVSDGTTIWFYDADLEQVTQQKFSEDFKNTPALLLGGDAEKISSQFNVTMAVADTDPTSAGSKQAPQRFLLHPIAANAMFDSLALDILNGKILSLRMKDSLGQTTTIDFHEIKINTNVEDKLFTFVPPPGVEIIVDE